MRKIKIDRSMGLAEDGITNRYGTCGLCGRTDILAPVNSIHLCPKCLGKGCLTSKEVKLERSGICSVCGVHYLGAGVYVPHTNVCFKCLYWKLAHKRGKGLKVHGRRII